MGLFVVDHAYLHKQDALKVVPVENPQKQCVNKVDKYFSGVNQLPGWRVHQFKWIPADTGATFIATSDMAEPPRMTIKHD